jgi:hypothetical protein
MRSWSGLLLAILVLVPSIGLGLSTPPTVPEVKSFQNPPIESHAAPPVSLVPAEAAVAEEPRPAPPSVTELAQDAQLTPQAVLQWAHAQFYAQGRQVPPPDFGDFEADASLMFTYPVQDLDGDGVQDVVLNAYCVSADACNAFGRGQAVGLSPRTFGTEYCGLHSRLYGVSGANGSILWTRPMGTFSWNVMHPSSVVDGAIGLCPMEFVVGQVSLGANRSGILVYAYATTADGAGINEPLRSMPVILIRHALYVLDPETLKVVWSHRYNGSLAFVGTQAAVLALLHVRADNLLVNPILQAVAQRGTQVLPANTGDALFFQGVGFNFTIVQTTRQTGMTTGIPILDSYKAQEWAARVNIPSGELLWTADTFEPEDRRSVMPWTLQSNPLPVPRGLEALSTGSHFWGYSPCCYDVTGDGVPDLVYLTREWPEHPLIEDQGPFMVASSLIVFDGQTGQRKYQVVTEPATQRYIIPEFDAGQALVPWVQYAGDLNGDGTSDILLHIEYLQEDYRHVLSARDGPTGQEIWRMERTTNLRAAVLGDANGDGSNDIVVFGWHFWEYPYVRTYKWANVTAVHLGVYSGLDGSVLWRTETLNAPVDLALMMRLLVLGGLPDVNGDGVADVVVDDPLFLDDLTVVHRVSLLDGRSGRALWSLTTVGTFAIPVLIGDINSDGRDDLGLLNGDMMDLWLTAFNGADGNASWSRRVMTPRISDFMSALPLMRFDQFPVSNGTAPLSLMTFHFEVTTRGFAFGRVVGLRSFLPQLLVMSAQGNLSWSVPYHADESIWVHVAGLSPASQAFVNLIDHQKRDALSRTHDGASDYYPWAGLAFGGSAVASFALSRVRRRFA